MKQKELDEKITAASKSILSYCVSRTSNQQDAEDLAQDILYEIVKSAANLRDDRAFYGFMWTVAGNVYKQWYRKKLTVNECELTDEIHEDSDELNAVLEDNTDTYLLRRELTLLSEKYRCATILYYLENKSCVEIAQILSISESMVKYLLFKSRKILKEGMIMERNFGELSYNPKKLIPMYSGEGPNYFWDFMQSRIRQNIVSACYNDLLTEKQISLETGIPLPYIDDELKVLVDKNILLKDGKHYKSNVIIITSDCEDEVARSAALYHEKIADKIGSFLDATLDEYKSIGFTGADFSRNTLRWQLATLIFRSLMSCQSSVVTPERPKTAWGEHAFLWLKDNKQSWLNIFAYSGMGSSHGDGLYFFDYRPQPDQYLKGDHHDFYGNERYINIICDIARGECGRFSEYDLEAIAEMVKKGYVLKNGAGYRTATLIYTETQYEKAKALAEAFVNDKLTAIINELNLSAVRILHEHAPKYLQDQVAGIACMDSFTNTVCQPGAVMIEKELLTINYSPCEMPTTYIVLNK